MKSARTAAAENAERGGSLRRCVLLGAGGHARVVIDCLLDAGVVTPCAVLDSDETRWGSEVLGLPVLGGDEKLPELARNGITCFAVGVGSTGDARLRRELFEFGLATGLTAVAVQHPTAVRSRLAEVGPGCQLLPLSVVNAGATLGVNVILNTAAVVEHDCVISDHVHIATGARLAGGVRVGQEAHVGLGAVVLQGLTIGTGAVVGAGAVVVEDVLARSTVVGVPARARKVMTD